MKKLFILFLTAATVSFGTMGALSLLPHSHGNDFNHAQHETCPVYQAGIAGKNFTATIFVWTIFLASALFIEKISPVFIYFKQPRFSPLRAPPAFSSR